MDLLIIGLIVLFVANVAYYFHIKRCQREQQALKELERKLDSHFCNVRKNDEE